MSGRLADQPMSLQEIEFIISTANNPKRIIFGRRLYHIVLLILQQLVLKLTRRGSRSMVIYPQILIENEKSLVNIDRN